MNQQAEAQFGGEKMFVQTGGVGTVVANESDLDKALAELTRQAESKVDLIVPAQSLKAEPFVDDRPIPGAEGGTEMHYGLNIAVPIPNFPPILMSVNPFAHAQLATALGIGTYYYNKMLEGDLGTMTLLADNVNHWLRRREGNFLVRTLDNHIRAFLSDKYAIRDSLDLLLASMEPIIDSGAKVTQVILTERRFHLRALHSEWRERVARQQRDVNERGQIFQSWMADLKANAEGFIPYFSRQDPNPANPLALKGDFGLRSDWNDDWIIPGIHIGNSEVGQGSTEVAPRAVRVICMNGTTMDTVIASRHVGRRAEANALDPFISRETLEKENEALWAGIQDIVKACFDPEQFRAMVEAMSASTDEVIAEPVRAVDDTINRFNIAPARKQQLLNHLLAGGDPTRWGLINAVTAMAHDVEDPIEAHQLEQVGGQMLAVVRR